MRNRVGWLGSLLASVMILSAACTDSGFGPQATRLRSAHTGLEIPEGWRWWRQYIGTSSTGYILTDGTLVNPTALPRCDIELEAEALAKDGSGRTVIVGRGRTYVGRMEPNERRAFRIPIYVGPTRVTGIAFQVAGTEC